MMLLDMYKVFLLFISALLAATLGCCSSISVAWANVHMCLI